MSNTIHCSSRDQSFDVVAPGVSFCVLRRHHEGGMTVLVRMDKGAHARLHDHPGGEETYLVSGSLRVGDRQLSPGDYLWTPPGEAHDGFADEESVFFVVLPSGLRLVEEPAKTDPVVPRNLLAAR
jgi:quercetin dioxygenase-like cupin family protein